MQHIIQFSSVDRSSRIRSTYSGIEDLAQSILDHGLIQPIVISPKSDGNYLLNAGGRRSAALDFLLVNNKWDGILHHGVTCAPGRPGYVLKDEPDTELSSLMTEIAENLNREDMPWQDDLKAIVKAARLIRQQEHANGHMIIQHDLGSIIGCGYQDLRAAEATYADLIANPTDYAMATGIRQAYAITLKKNKDYLMGIYNQNALGQVKVVISPTDSVQEEPSSGGAILLVAPNPPTIVPLTSFFRQGSWMDWDLGPASVDHIITDPDYGVAPEHLEAGVAGAAAGVNQTSIDDSLDQMYMLADHAWRWLKPNGWFIFFYDLDHHEKLRAVVEGAGFAVQRWPLTWHKLDYRSNAAPSHNTCKNVEWAMLCRKPGATLAASPQMSSIFACNSGDAVKRFGHPFAKPEALYHHLFSLCCIKGQTVLDPCAGRGSMLVAALDWGLNPIGCEVDPDHYNGLLFNLQTAYHQRLGPNVQFT